MSLVNKAYNAIAMTSPDMEVRMRKLYWRNVRFLKGFRPHGGGAEKIAANSPLDFDSIVSFLRDNKVDDGSLIVVHSSFDALSSSGLKPREIIDKLIDLIGPNGTLAMPAIRKYRGAPRYENILDTDISQLVCTYNARKTAVISGILPYTLLKMPGSAVSLHPLNPMVAIGPLANEMMKNNIFGDAPSPHGPNSSWKYCYDHNAIIIGLGVDLDHYNTICHINEEAFGNWKWSDEEWFRLRKFIVIGDDGIKQEITVKERKPEWGMLRFAEMHACKDRNDHGLIHHYSYNGVPICVSPAVPLIDHLQDNTKKGIYYYL